MSLPVVLRFREPFPQRNNEVEDAKPLLRDSIPRAARIQTQRFRAFRIFGASASNALVLARLFMPQLPRQPTSTIRPHPTAHGSHPAAYIIFDCGVHVCQLGPRGMRGGFAFLFLGAQGRARPPADLSLGEGYFDGLSLPHEGVRSRAGYILMLVT